MKKLLETLTCILMLPFATNASSQKQHMMDN